MVTVRNDGKNHRIPKEAARRGIVLNFQGKPYTIVARKFPGSFKIKVMPDLSVKVDRWNLSDPMKKEDLEKIFQILGMSFVLKG